MDEGEGTETVPTREKSTSEGMEEVDEVTVEESLRKTLVG